MPDQPNQPQAPAPQPSTENQAPQAPTEISSLQRYMAARANSSNAPEGQPKPAATPPAQGEAASSPDAREQFIPRSRFDEVLNERNQLRAQVQQPQLPPQGFQTGMQVPMQPQFQQPQAVGPTGMVGAQPQPARPANVPDFADPTVQKQWRDKIANNPVTGLREFVSLLIQAEGGPLLEQFRQQITQQISPIQQTFLQQQLNSYASQRSQADPTFTQVAPVFNQLVGQAAQRGMQLTPQVLQAIEGIARAQTGTFAGQTQQRPVPFTETPGGTGNLGQAQQPALSPLERAMAERFGMTPAEYAAQQRTYG